MLENIKDILICSYSLIDFIKEIEIRLLRESKELISSFELIIIKLKLFYIYIIKLL